MRAAMRHVLLAARLLATWGFVPESISHAHARVRPALSEDPGARNQSLGTWARAPSEPRMNVPDTDSALDLGNIRESLRRMEDSIIFSLIERSQYRTNDAVYMPNCQQLGTFRLHQLKSAGSNGCLGDWFIYQTESLHSQVRRYQHPTEFHFFGPLPEPTLGSTSGSRTDADPILAPVPRDAIVNERLLEIYRTKMVPALCEVGDDGNHGSTAVQDVHCLQTMATRIYYGLFVAESKFRQETERATALIKARDTAGLMAFITKPDVEEKNIRRVILKARTFAQDIPSGQDGQLAPELTSETTYKVNPDYIGTVFRDFLMPLTKDVEVAYLLSRLDDLDGRGETKRHKTE